jgi:aspartate racemase
MTAARRINGILDLATLRKALNEVMKRHEVLRATFPERNGVPVQVIEPSPKSIPVRYEDLRDLNRNERLRKADELGESEAHRVFDLEHGPVFRAAVASIDDEYHVLYLSMPHIVCDGWSIGILLSEVATAYWAFVGGGASPLSDLPLQYSDYVEWQRGFLQGQELERLLSYWIKQLEGTNTLLPLPLDRPRPYRQGHRGEGIDFAFSTALSTQIRNFSRAQRVTPFVVLLGLFGLLLGRYSGETRIPIGSPIANRNWPELESLIGLFVNMLVLIVDCGGDPTLRQFIARVHDMLLGAHAHQDMPFERLVEEVNPQRSPSHSPLFQVTFVLHNTPLASEFKLISGGAMFDLAVYVWDEPSGIRGTFSYNSDIFARTTIDRFVENYVALVERSLEQPDLPLSQISCVSATERSLLERWSGRTTECERKATVADLFERCVEEHGDAVALSWRGGELTYSAVNERANAIAHRLHDRGVQAGALVGICAERSAEAVIAILGILKSGAAYVPLDPTYPRERIHFMVRDTRASVVLTQVGLGDRCPRDVDVLMLEEADLRATTAGNPARRTIGDDLAYVMYTSGSTGEPKGVRVRHRSVIRLVRQTDYASLGPHEVFLQYAPISFDASTFELWGALLNGGRLAIAPPGLLTLAELGSVVREQRVTTMWLTAGLFHQVVDAGLEDYKSVRQLLTGGDVVSPSHAKKALETLEDCTLINGYGPTENTTFTCCHSMRSPQEVRAPVPIGKPINNTRVYILDDSRELLPLGAIGTLYAGGDGVAAGYHDRSRLTAERFVADPFSDDPEAMLYQTGDRVRWLQDGTIEFLGRNDDQVKVRGFRIELAEIEAAMRAIPGVGEAAVITHEDSQKEKSLVAYFSPSNERRVPSVERMRSHLEGKLPQYMLPNQFIHIERIPINANGKVDRKALPSPRLVRSTGPIRPLTRLEVQLMAIWEQVLDVTGVGVDESFFDLGGNSLMAVRMFSQLRRAVGRELPISALFAAPTIGRLAALVEADGWAAATKSLVAVQPMGTKRPLFLVPGVGGNVLIFARLANLLGRDQPLYGLQSRGLDGEESPLMTIEEIAKAYVQEIRRVQPRGPYLLGGACMGGVVAFEMAQQMIASGEKVAHLALIETWSPTSLRPRRYRLLGLLHPFVFVFDGVVRHLRAMTRLPPRGWIAYLREKAGIIKEMVQERDVYRGDRGLYYNDLVSAANYRAMSNYVPRTYDGRMDVYLASKRPIDAARDTRMKWTTLAAEGYSIHRIDATDSGQLFVDPHIGELARHLRSAIGDHTSIDSASSQQEPGVEW